GGGPKPRRPQERGGGPQADGGVWRLPKGGGRRSQKNVHGRRPGHRHPCQRPQHGSEHGCRCQGSSRASQEAARPVAQEISRSRK
ncbi:unnamed protein product, partial [Ectocarpus sp. 12 AP-2014]